MMAARGGQNVGDKTGPQTSHCGLRHAALKDLRLYFGIFAAVPKMDTNPGVCRLLTFGSPGPRRRLCPIVHSPTITQ